VRGRGGGSGWKNAESERERVNERVKDRECSGTIRRERQGVQEREREERESE